ncbi:MAG: TrbC/VirB2 family protein [Succinivibrio sp.]|nr:TrbC/VirB2 family protein [Succinivibrio sp.]
MKILKKISTTLILLGLCFEVMAAETSSGALPYEGWLRTLQQSFTGPVAFSVSLLGIISCGATLIFMGGEIGRFVRSIVYLVLVMTLLIGANSMMTRFFNGAVISSAVNTTQEHKINPSTTEELSHFLSERLTVHS